MQLGPDNLTGHPQVVKVSNITSDTDSPQGGILNPLVYSLNT